MASNVSDTYRPRIALTSYFQEAVWGVWKTTAAILPGTYVEAVVAAGGTPILLPKTISPTVIVLSGASSQYSSLRPLRSLC